MQDLYALYEKKDIKSSFVNKEIQLNAAKIEADVK
jgi:hypothetical protein